MSNNTFTDEHFMQIMSSITSSNGGMSSCPASYDGSKDPKSVEAFIYAIIIYKTVKQISDDQVIDGLPLLLHGDAAKWWQEIRNEVHSWEELKNRLRSSLVSTNPTQSNETPMDPAEVNYQECFEGKYKTINPTFTDEHFDKIISAITSSNSDMSSCPASYDGNKDSKAVEAFIYAIIIYKTVKRISDDEVIEGLPLLLHGDAAKWWQGIKSEVNSWQEFQHCLRSSLVPTDPTKSNERPTEPAAVDKISGPTFTDKHFEHITSALASRSRGMSSTLNSTKPDQTPTKPAEVMYQELFSEKQGTSISTESFIGKKRKLFSMLPKPTHSEEQQLNMIYGLLHENIRHKIPRGEINSYDQLIEKARNVERELWLPTLMEYDNATVERSRPAIVEVDTLPRPYQQDGGNRGIKLIRPLRDVREVRKVQLKDDYIQMVVSALEIPDSKEFTAYWREQGYLMHNSLLYHCTLSSEMGPAADFAQLVVPEIEWERMVSAFHDDHHYNSDIVYGAISKRYFWKKMQEYIDSYVRNCARCQRAKKYNIPPVIYFN